MDGLSFVEVREYGYGQYQAKRGVLDLDGAVSCLALSGARPGL